VSDRGGRRRARPGRTDRAEPAPTDADLPTDGQLETVSWLEDLDRPGDDRLPW
jgi:hypothetical protein